MTDYSKLDAWVDAHFDEEVRFLQELVRVPTDTPPGNNAPHAERTAELLRAFGMQAEAHPVPEQEVRDYGLQSITNLIVRREYGPGRRVALNAHGDVVPPGEGWRHDPYGAQIEDGNLYAPRPSAKRLRQLHLRRARAGGRGRAAMARSSCISPTTRNSAACWDRAGLRLADQARPADRGRLQLRRGVGAQRLPADGSHRARRNGARGRARDRRGRAAGRGPDPERAVRAERALSRGPLAGAGHHPPYLNVGRIEGGTNTNVVPGKVSFKLDRRMIPEENAAEVEADIHRVIEDAAATFPGIRVEIKRLLLANAMRPLPGNKPLVDAIQRHGREIFGEDIPALGTRSTPTCGCMRRPASPA